MAPGPGWPETAVDLEPTPIRAHHAVALPSGRVLALGERTAVMGVLNRTPDSFYDGGRFADLDAALAAGERMAEQGADLIDVGGESTRPGAEPVEAEEQSRRVLPVIEALARRALVPLSIDTTHAAVARRALDAGAELVNDVSALEDPEMPALVAARAAGVVLMHRRGTARTMQLDTRYADLPADVGAFLRAAAERARAAGVPAERIFVDPGLGFGKSADGSLTLLRRLGQLARLGHPIVVGASRKSFIGQVLELPVEQRLAGSLAAAAAAAWLGAHVVRVHDVAPTVQVVRLIDALRGA